MERLALTLVCLLATASLVLRLTLALGPLENIDGVTLPDDAYLFLDIARSIGQGEGPLYGREFTNGFQPLFAFVLAPLFWIWEGGDAPVHASLVLGALFDTAALGVLALLARSLAGGSWWPAVVIAAGWVTNHNSLRNCLNGMETSLALLCLSVALLAHRRVLSPPPDGSPVPLTPARAAALGATVGLAMLARVDSVLFAAVLGAWIGWLVMRGRLRFDGPALPRIAAWCGGAAAVFSLWLLYSWAYTGDLYPVSGRAVRFQADAHYEILNATDESTWIHIRRAAGEIYRGNLVFLLAAFAVLTAAVCVARGRTVAAVRAALGTRALVLVPLAVWVAVLFAAYAGYIHGTWFFHRYLFPVVLPVSLGLAAAFTVASHEWGAARRAGAAAVLGLALLIGGVVQPDFGWITTQGRDGNFGYRAIGQWTADRFAAGTVLGAKQSGAIGYYAHDCDVLNLDGVVSKNAFAAILADRVTDYCAEQGITHFVLWQYGADFLARYSRAAETPRVFERIETVPDVHSWGDAGTNEFAVYQLR